MALIEEIFIDEIEQLNQLLFTAEYQAEYGRHRDIRLYRGLCDSSYNLVTSLRRNCKNLDDKLEKNILDNFGKYAAIEDPSMNSSVWRRMILGQHHGLPTRLLDWTRSPLVALHFAMTEGNMDMMDQHDCVVWELNVKKLHDALPPKYQKIMNESGQHIFSLGMIQQACKDNISLYDEDMGKDMMVILEPPSIDARIMNQYSFFSVVPTGVEKVEDIFESRTDAVKKYIISKNLRWQIRDMLDQANINERIIYPGLDGIAKWIGRHYFVRETNRLRISKADITHLNVDAIVNSANEKLAPAGSVCKHIFDVAGEKELVDACRQIGGCLPGSMVVTDGFALKAKHIVHAVAPNFGDGKDYQKKMELLKDVYLGALNKAVENKWNSIAFPLLCAGRNGLDTSIAWEVALKTCISFLDDYNERCKANNSQPLDITFCVINEEVYQRGEFIRKSLSGHEMSSDDVKMINLFEEDRFLNARRFNC